MDTRQGVIATRCRSSSGEMHGNRPGYTMPVGARHGVGYPSCPNTCTCDHARLLPQGFLPRSPLRYNGATKTPGARVSGKAWAYAEHNAVQGETAMPFYEKGDVRIYYEEAGSGFSLLLIPGGA